MESPSSIQFNGNDSQVNKDYLDLDVWDGKIETPNPLKKSGFMRMLIVGPSDSGKSYLLEHLAKKKLKKLYEKVIVICGSRDTLKDYGNVFDTNSLYSNYDPRDIDIVKGHQRELEAKGKPMLKVLIVYDDFGTRKNKHDESIFNLAIQGRHDCISFVMVLHDLVLADRIVRDNFTHIILTRQSSYDVYNRLIEEFLLMMADNDPAISEDHKRSKQTMSRYIRNTLVANSQNFYVIVVLLQASKKAMKSNFKEFVLKYKA